MPCCGRCEPAALIILTRAPSVNGPSISLPRAGIAEIRSSKSRPQEVAQPVSLQSALSVALPISPHPEPSRPAFARWRGSKRPRCPRVLSASVHACRLSFELCISIGIWPNISFGRWRTTSFALSFALSCQSLAGGGLIEEKARQRRKLANGK
jgi:hypothetical protein